MVKGGHGSKTGGPISVGIRWTLGQKMTDTLVITCVVCSASIDQIHM